MSTSEALAASSSELRPSQVVIYGNPGERWREALSPWAPVWARIPAVREVVMVESGPDPRIPASRSPGLDSVIVPLTERDAATCPSGRRSLSPEPLAIDTFWNKASFARYVERAGLSELCPVRYRNEAEAQFPCVLKSLRNSCGRGVAVVESAAHLHALLQRPPWLGKSVLLQALVEGTEEFVTHCVCRAGKILWSCSFVYELDSGDLIRTTRNVRAPRQHRPSPAILAQIAGLIAPSGYTGPCNLDYKITEAGRIAVFEINARLGGSLMAPERVDELADALACIIRHAA